MALFRGGVTNPRLIYHISPGLVVMCLGNAITPIQDVRTRWNFTFLVLRRAKQLQPVFGLYYTTHQYLQFKLEKVEWHQINYLLSITEPFFKLTTALSKTKDIVEIFRKLTGTWRYRLSTAPNVWGTVYLVGNYNICNAKIGGFV